MVVVPVAAPLKASVTPVAPLTAPVIFQVEAAAVKLVAATLALLTVTARLVGVKVNPALLGVTV